MMGHNSKPWIENAIQSTVRQNHKNFDVITIDAQTTDGTYDYLLEQEKVWSNLKVVRNETRKYQSQNVYEGSQMAKEGSIIVTVDFDDWLPHQNVLQTLDQYYNDDVWMTYGSKYHTSHMKGVHRDEYVQLQFQGEGRYSDDVVRENKFRHDKWRATHLRTFRRELILKIDPKDFLDDDGEWFKAGGDLTFMWPMLEMSGERFEFIPKGMYVYNEQNENSDWQKVPHEQLRVEKIMRSRLPYQRLENL